MSAEQNAVEGLSEGEQHGGIGRVDFTCEWCGGHFTFTPSLLGAGLGVSIHVARLDDECVRHEARIVDLREQGGAS